MKTPKIDFLVVGAAKAGTTALHEFLAQHPNISLPVGKETLFFVYPEIERSGYYKHLGWKTGPEKTLSRYFDDFMKKEKVLLRGEVCPAYLDLSYYAAPTIQQMFPEALILVILRHPAESIFSNFFYLKSRYDGIPGDFSTYLRRSLSGQTNGDYDFFGLTLQNIKYYPRLKPYYEHFPPNNIFCIRYDDLLDQPNKTVKDILRYIGAPEYEIDTGKRFNVTGSPRSQVLSRMAQYIQAKLKVRKRLPVSVYQHIRPIYESLMFKQVNSLKPAERQELLNYYRDDILATQALTGLDLSDWLETE